MATTNIGGPFLMRDAEKTVRERDPDVHIYGKANAVCATDIRGRATPNMASPVELVVDASEGFIPLWAEGTTLRWRFQERSFSVFADPNRAKSEMRLRFGQGLLEWGSAVPVKFAERNDAWDFEIVVKANDDCDINGCVLASAFFPDAGRHELTIYPQMLKQDQQEQIETVAHELGHIFGLRHFFANVSEAVFPSEIFGCHKRFSIMNYGAESVMTEADQSDLAALYKGAWSGELPDINGTPIRLMRPFSSFRLTST